LDILCGKGSKIVSKKAAMFFGFLLAGCAGEWPKELGAPFDRAEHQGYLGSATSVVFGQAFLKQNGGGVVTCAGETVTYLPNTTYFRELIKMIRTGARFRGELSEEIATKVRQYGKYNTCDAGGNFSAALPPGEWYVFTNVSWTVGYAPQGGTVGGFIKSEAGKRTQIILNQR